MTLRYAGEAANEEVVETQSRLALADAFVTGP